ncbi:MAG TPA: hypothetical protein VK427_13965, partial [Kofleriaceae bacterium]|nr:hypothetical protein [Kofleriaceae bacterium]
AATPAPPADADPALLLAMSEEVHEARAQLIAAAEPLEALAGKASPAIAAELRARDAEWLAALTSARDLLGKSRVGTSGKLGAYAADF